MTIMYRRTENFHNYDTSILDGLNTRLINMTACIRKINVVIFNEINVI